MGRMDKIKNSLKIHITTGDVATPKEIEYLSCLWFKNTLLLNKIFL